jgi:magnesium-transporting ATPase (P-type)
LELEICILILFSRLIFQTSRQSVLFQIREGAAQLTAHRGSSQQAFALIIDGKSLAYALEDDMKNMFLELAIRCASVICCRSSPKQKALVFFNLSRVYILFILMKNLVTF